MDILNRVYNSDINDNINYEKIRLSAFLFNNDTISKPVINKIKQLLETKWTSEGWNRQKQVIWNTIKDREEDERNRLKHILQKCGMSENDAIQLTSLDDSFTQNNKTLYELNSLINNVCRKFYNDKKAKFEEKRPSIEKRSENRSKLKEDKNKLKDYEELYTGYVTLSKDFMKNAQKKLANTKKNQNKKIMINSHAAQIKTNALLRQLEKNYYNQGIKNKQMRKQQWKKNTSPKKLALNFAPNLLRNDNKVTYLNKDFYKKNNTINNIHKNMTPTDILSTNNMAFLNKNRTKKVVPGESNTPNSVPGESNTPNSVPGEPVTQGSPNNNNDNIGNSFFVNPNPEGTKGKGYKYKKHTKRSRKLHKKSKNHTRRS